MMVQREKLRNSKHIAREDSTKVKVREMSGWSWSHGKRLLRTASFAVDLWADGGCSVSWTCSSSVAFVQHGGFEVTRQNRENKKQKQKQNYV